jgi:hypothetical protein
MAVRLTDIPTLLVERVEAAHPEPALFSAAETDAWPSGILEHLLRRSVLRPTHRAEWILCPGCEWQCHKPVVVRTTSKGSKLLAFVACDEEPDHGRISVPLQSLTQYSATLLGMSAFMSELMKLGSPRSTAAGRSILLGTIKGRYGSRAVSVDLRAGRLMLHVGRQQESVTRVLRWIEGRLSMDMEHVRRLAGRKESAHGSKVYYLPDCTKRQARSRQTLARNQAIFREAKKRRVGTGESWTHIAHALAAMDLSKVGDRRVGAATMRRIITEMSRRERENSRSGRRQHK